MLIKLDSVPDEFWEVWHYARISQLLYFEWEGSEAKKFADNEIKMRKSIDGDLSPEDAIFSIVKLPRYPLENGDAYFLKLLEHGPFEHPEEDIGVPEKFRCFIAKS